MAITNPTLNSETAKNFITSRNLQVHPEVRANKNGYPYVTFIDENNDAYNIYFSKSSASEFKAGDKIVRGFFDKISFVEVTYDDERENQWKMTTNSGNRLNSDDLF